MNRKPEDAQGCDGGLLQLELEPQLVLELMSKQEVCAADLRCLNRRSKKLLKSICLTACLDVRGKHIKRHDIGEQ